MTENNHKHHSVPALSIVVPTFNESENLGFLIRKVQKVTAQAGIETEIVVVDDNSPDGTAVIGRGLGARVIVREGRSGLGSAIIEGIEAATAPVVCVIDADLSHPPEKIVEMYQIIKNGEADLVVGSRTQEGGGTTEWIWYRKVIHLVARVLGSYLTTIGDITSGFFMFDKRIIENVKLRPSSWKIGLEIMVKGKYRQAVEVPIIFREREAGKSKMKPREVFAYLLHLVNLSLYKLSGSRLCS
jgi:dolichol-phosphate mannosyltransferase